MFISPVRAAVDVPHVPPGRGALVVSSMQGRPSDGFQEVSDSSPCVGDVPVPSVPPGRGTTDNQCAWGSIIPFNGLASLVFPCAFSVPLCQAFPPGAVQWSTDAHGDRPPLNKGWVKYPLSVCGVDVPHVPPGRDATVPIRMGDFLSFPHIWPISSATSAAPLFPQVFQFFPCVGKE